MPKRGLSAIFAHSVKTDDQLGWDETLSSTRGSRDNRDNRGTARWGFGYRCLAHCSFSPFPRTSLGPRLWFLQLSWTENWKLCILSLRTAEYSEFEEIMNITLSAMAHHSRGEITPRLMSQRAQSQDSPKRAYKHHPPPQLRTKVPQFPQLWGALWVWPP